MPTWGAVGLGADNADAEPDEIRSMYDETLGLPPKAPYLCAVKSLKKGETGPNSQAPGTPKIVMVLEIAEPPGTVKAKYNGYAFFLHRSVTEEGAGRINRLLKALLGNTSLTDAKKTAILKAFWDGKVVYDKDTEVITKIGTWAIPEGLMLGVTTRKGKWQGDDTLEVDGEMSPKDAPKGRLAGPEDEDDAAAEDETEEAAEDDGEDPEVTARGEELAEMTDAKLKTVAKGLGAKLADYKALDHDDLVEFILDLEFPVEGGDDEEAEDESEEESDEPEGDEFDEMDRAALKKYNKDEELGVRVTVKMTDDELREAIRAALPDDETEEETEEDDAEEAEDEPEPPARPARRGTAAAKPAPKGRPAARRRGGKDEPPF